MNKKILIVGLGLIGGSYAKGLTKKGYEVSAITKDQKDLDYALDNHIIVNGSVEVTEEFVSSFDNVIFALYPTAFLKWIKEYGRFLKKTAIISDVTGIKCEIVHKIQKELPEGVEFIAAHPMAGREKSGVMYADEKIFHNANYIITPTDKNSERALMFAHEIGEALEFKNIATLSLEEHDEMIAFLSQLTHCIAVSLMTCKDSTHLNKYTGDSFRDLTRIASINENMWCELFLMNKKKLVEEMDLFIKEFISLKTAIENEDQETIKEKMILSTKRRSDFDK